MALLTTKLLGETTADPKPVHGFNWTGQPMKDGEDYWGNKIAPDAPPAICTPCVARLDDAPLPRQPKGRKARYEWSTERKQAMSDTIKTLWREKRDRMMGVRDG